jgi:NADP-dependent 3-hydroxy acid dehydrogenase YdfG
MFASPRTLLSALAVLVLSASTSTNAFVHRSTSSTFGVPKAATKSSLNMLADDPKVILVTGSSRGLGKSIALDIGAQGHKIIVNYVSDSSKESADATVEEIKAAGGDAVAIQADCEYHYQDY